MNTSMAVKCDYCGNIVDNLATINETDGSQVVAVSHACENCMRIFEYVKNEYEANLNKPTP